MGGSQPVHLFCRPAGFLAKLNYPVHKEYEPVYEAINAELDRLAELGGTSRPREQEPAGAPSMLHHPGALPSSHGGLLAVVAGPSGQALQLSGLRPAGFLDAGHCSMPADSHVAYAAINAELDRLAQLGGSSKPRDTHPGTLLPLFPASAVAAAHGSDGEQQEGKGKRFKPLSILLPDSTAAPPAPGNRGSTTPAGAAGTAAGAAQGHCTALVPGGLAGAADTPGAGMRGASLGLGLSGTLPEGLALPSPALSPLMFSHESMDFGSFLLSARGPGHLSDLKGGSLWSPSSGSAGLGSLPRPGHLGGFSDEAEGDDGGWEELGSHAGAGDSGGLMVMGRSLSRAALTTLEHHEREGGGDQGGGADSSPSSQQQQPHRQEPTPAQGPGLPLQLHTAHTPGCQQQEQQQPEGHCQQGQEKQGQGGVNEGTKRQQAYSRRHERGEGLQPMELEHGMELPLDL